MCLIFCALLVLRFILPGEWFSTFLIFNGNWNEKKTDSKRDCFRDDTAAVIGLLDFGGSECGAYGGYKMKEHGYTLQNPITKEKKSKKWSSGW